MSIRKDGYQMDFINHTLTMTADFAENAAAPNSNEYQILHGFMSDFPNLVIKRHTHRTPKSYRSKDGRVSRNNPTKGFTYKRMEAFMRSISNSEKYLKEYETVRNIAEACSSPHAIVRKWFIAQFPEYSTNPLYYLNHSPEIIDYSSIVSEANTSLVS
jgi:hypothetical protein